MGFFSSTPKTKMGTTKGFYFGKPEAEAEFSIHGQTLAEYFEDFFDVKSKIARVDLLSRGEMVLENRR